jgi:hypothetical protein
MDTQFILDNNQVEGQGSNQVTLNNSPQHLCIPKLLQMWHQMHSQDILNKEVEVALCSCGCLEVS